MIERLCPICNLVIKVTKHKVKTVCNGHTEDQL